MMYNLQMLEIGGYFLGENFSLNELKNMRNQSQMNVPDFVA